jgi:hypothetical protein
MRKFLRRLFPHHHGDYIYADLSGKPCVYKDCHEPCPGTCLIPVYHVICGKCGQTWDLGEDDLIDFFTTNVEKLI